MYSQDLSPLLPQAGVDTWSGGGTVIKVEIEPLRLDLGLAQEPSNGVSLCYLNPNVLCCEGEMVVSFPLSDSLQCSKSLSKLQLAAATVRSD